MITTGIKKRALNFARIAKEVNIPNIPAFLAVGFLPEANNLLISQKTREANRMDNKELPIVIPREINEGMNPASVSPKKTSGNLNLGKAVRIF
jgi:hypothetical protein